jgi:hypothetical protein
MHNQQFDGERSSGVDIQQRLYMEHHMLTSLDGGLPDDDTALCQLIHDAYVWIIQAKRVYGIPDNWRIETED